MCHYVCHYHVCPDVYYHLCSDIDIEFEFIFKYQKRQYSIIEILSLFVNNAFIYCLFPLLLWFINDFGIFFSYSYLQIYTIIAGGKTDYQHWWDVKEFSMWQDQGTPHEQDSLRSIVSPLLFGALLGSRYLWKGKTLQENRESSDRLPIREVRGVAEGGVQPIRRTHIVILVPPIYKDWRICAIRGEINNCYDNRRLWRGYPNRREARNLRPILP